MRHSGEVTFTAADAAAPLARYARRFHAAVGERHHVAAPLGAWLLLALCGPACDGEARKTLNATLGCDDLDGAAALAAGLLSRPHPLVRAAAAVWHRQEWLTGALSRWQDSLPPEVETGTLTTSSDLDEWARRHTDGLIRRFPLDLTPEVLLVLATALATKVSWERPFDLAPASLLGPASPWATALARVLRTPDGPGHDQFVAATAQAGEVAVQSARARGGLLVTSVAAAPGVPAAEVLAAAYDLATALAAGGPVTRRSLFDLPLGEGPLWTVAERRVLTTAAQGREERCTAVLPAWSATSDHDLARPGLGFDVAAGALARLLGLREYRWKAGQSAMARYSRVGFEAAAVSAVMVAAAALLPRQGLLRTAELRFGHPFAVVAVTADEPPGSAGPWHGMPVFSAWVAEPEDAEPEDAPQTGL